MFFRRCLRLTVVAVAIVCSTAHEGAAYSVLAHESNVDLLWNPSIRPLLAHRFPHATEDQLRDARAFAYGGSVIQDLGYYPFGSHFFSNLLHYVRSGDFVETLVHDAADVNELAFALGALAHYAADNTGHPEAVNRAVAMLFPKLRAKYGDTITYAKSPSRHVMVEFSFDVVQAAAGVYPQEAYRGFLGFEVSKPLLERAFREVYGLELDDVFLFDVDLAIGTYRHAISETFPELTRAAWRDKHDEIRKLLPSVAENTFVFTFPRQQYEREFGTSYKKPSWFDRFLGWLYGLLPKIGPLQPLKFETPTAPAEALFLASLRDTRDRYRRTLDMVRDRRLDLANTDFDTGRPSAHGEYELADETYAKLLDKFAGRKFEGMPDSLKRNIIAYYDAAPDRVSGPKEAKRLKTVRRQLTALRSSAGRHD